MNSPLVTGSRRQASPRPQPHQENNDVTGGTARHFHAGTARPQGIPGLARTYPSGPMLASPPCLRLWSRHAAGRDRLTHRLTRPFTVTDGGPCRSPANSPSRRSGLHRPESDQGNGRLGLAFCALGNKRREVLDLLACGGEISAYPQSLRTADGRSGPDEYLRRLGGCGSGGQQGRRPSRPSVQSHADVALPRPARADILAA